MSDQPPAPARRVLAQQWVSADGFASGRTDESELFAALSDFSHGETHNLALLADVDRVLLGRRTYESFVRFWPTAEDQPMAPAVNGMPKTVFSTTLETAPWGADAPAEVVADAEAHVRGLRGEPGGYALIWGSLALMRSLLAAGLVDELELFVAPIALGQGTRLIDPDHPVPLELVDGEVWSSGAVRLRHRVLGDGSDDAGA